MNIQKKPPEEVFIELFDGKRYKCSVSSKYYMQGQRYDLILLEHYDHLYPVGYKFSYVGESIVKFER